MTKMSLRPYQSEALSEIRAWWDSGESNALAVLPTGAGKALRDDQRVLTVNGWVPISEISIGDKVFSPSGGTASVTGVFPQGKRQLMRVCFTDLTEVVCDLDHLWNVRSKYDKNIGAPWRTMTLRKMMEIGIKANGGNRWEIPSTKQIEPPTPFELNIDPYLLGAILGDGHLSIPGIVKITVRPGLADVIRSRLPDEIKLKYVIGAGEADTYRFSGSAGCKTNSVMAEIRSLGLEGHLSKNKTMPRCLMLMSSVDRMRLLNGLMDTDGSACRAGGCSEITLASKPLAEGVASLVRSLGGMAKVREKKTSWTHKGVKKRGIAWRVNVSTSWNPFDWKADRWNARKKYGTNKRVKSVEPAGVAHATCIKIDREDGLFITEGYTVTHNTILFSALGSSLRMEGMRRILILAHRKELVQQAADKWVKVDPGESVGIYMGSKRELYAAVISASVASCYTDVYRDDPCPACTVEGQKKGPGCEACEGSGTVSTFVRPGRLREGQLLGGKGRPDLDLSEVDLVIVDEAHHVTPESAYMRVIEEIRKSNPSALALFVTATPKREDRIGFGWLVNGVAFIISIASLIEDGYLAPFSKRSCRVELNVNMSDVRVSKKTGDFIDEDLGKALDTVDARRELVTAWRNEAGPGTDGAGEHGRQTVIFCPTVDAAEHLSEAFTDAGVKASWICSDRKRCSLEDRESRLDDFDHGRLTVIVNVGVLTEGWDSPACSCVVIYRPTKSSSLYRQMVGRGLRLSPETGKVDCLVMDCTGATKLGLQTLVDLSKPITKEEILGVEEEPEEDEPEQLVFPDEITESEVQVNGHMTYRIDLFSGRVAWARINGTRVACLSPGRAAIIFGSDDRFSACASSKKGITWLARDVDELAALKTAEIYALENGSEQWLNPGVFVQQRRLSTSQRGQLTRLLRWERQARGNNGQGPGLSLDEVGGLSMQLASAWTGYLEARLVFLRERGAA